MRSLFIIMSLFFIISCQVTTPIKAKNNLLIKVLIIDGFNNHDWRATTRVITKILEKDSDILIEVSTVPKITDQAWKDWLPVFSNYDVVIQNSNDINNDGAWPELTKKHFESYIAKGGAMLALHSANNAFTNWPEYNEMIGIGWRNKNYGSAITINNEKIVRIPAGKGLSTGHGARSNTVITKLGDHLIHKGLPKRWKAADIEVYRFARGPARNITVLSYALDKESNMNFPIEWVVQYGEGRVYSSTYGHYWHGLDDTPTGIRCMAFQTILSRSVRWLAKKEVPTHLPKFFPTETNISLYPIN